MARLLAVTYDAQDATSLAGFWAELLQREALPDAGGVLLPGGEGQLGLRLVDHDAPPQPRHRAHLHLTSVSAADQQEIVARALDLGAEHLDVGQQPEEGHVVLADPGGYEFCVIEPDNGFLAGCGPLGELTCDGSPAVGFFWSAALDWPLVWDEGEQTAIQAPVGGTKVSWDVWPVTYAAGQRLEIVADGNLGSEMARLVGLGAIHVRTFDDGVAILADPDGTEFRLR